MNLKEQLYVCTLAETGSLTQAAKQLFISQPALSLYISNLENTLGARLFERIGKQFVPTQVGELYVKAAKEMLCLKERFDTEFSEIQNGQKERIRVGIQAIRSHHLTPKMLPAITALYPKTKFLWYEDYYESMERMLLDHELDIFFCNCKTLRKEFEYIPILNDEIVFMAPKNHPLAVSPGPLPSHTFPWLDLTLFEGERFILTRESQSLSKYSWQVLKACQLVPKHIFNLTKIFNIITLVNSGYGVGFSLAGYISPNNALSPTDNLGVFSVVNPPITATFYGVYKRGYQPVPAVLTLIDMAKTLMAEQVSHLPR
ncbi:MAG: LysR family transcriptional regulator [Hungatella sp.]|nr:LysR family transcriptional regulator [Hungatella sp.]